MIQKKIFAILALASQLMSCGYTLQNSKNPLLLRTGIHKIYIEPIVNNTYKAGIENGVYNELVRTLTEHGRVQIVHSKNDADAVLSGQVNTAAYAASATSAVGSLTPLGVVGNSPLAAAPIATIYTATLDCTFALTSIQAPTFASHLKPPKIPSSSKMHPSHSPLLAHSPLHAKQKVKRPYAWSAHFTRTKPFPASNQLDVLGTTSVQINDSEFDRTLADLAHSMMADVHESMLSMF